MSTAALISLQEYLDTSYEPDMEFVDGVLVGRHLGTQLHSLLQAIVASYLRQYRKTHRISVFTETRLLVDAASGRHRIPDVMAVAAPYQRGRVVRDVPLIVVEIKSPDDTFDDIVGRCLDYDRLSIPNILVMDPDNQQAWLFRQNDLRLMSGAGVALRCANSEIDFQFAAMFAELDEG